MKIQYSFQKFYTVYVELFVLNFIVISIKKVKLIYVDDYINFYIYFYFFYKYFWIIGIKNVF